MVKISELLRAFIKLQSETLVDDAFKINQLSNACFESAIFVSFGALLCLGRDCKLFAKFCEKANTNYLLIRL